MESQPFTPSQPGLRPEVLYGPEYYKSSCGPVPYERNPHWLTFFSGIAEELIRRLQPKSVFDAGCAWGFLVEAFRDRGIRASGVDISDYAIQNVREDLRPYCSVASLTSPIAGGPYDLITCIEVMEHMAEIEARRAIANFAEATETILFSSTPDDFAEPTHVNVHEVEYWLRLFAAHGFYPDLLFDGTFIAPHAFLVRKRAVAMPEEVLLSFAETIGLRMQRVAFLLRQTRVEELEATTASLQHDVQQLAGELEEKLQANSSLAGLIDVLEQAKSNLEQQNHQLKEQTLRLEEQKSNLEAHQAELHARTAALEAHKAELEAHNAELEAMQLELSARLAQSSQTVTDFEYRLEDAKLRIAAGQSLIEEWVARGSELSGQVELLAAQNDVLHAEMEALQSGPAWQMISRYRDWLHTNRLRHRWIAKVWEPALLWTFRRAHLGSGSIAPRLLSPPAPSMAAAPAQIPAHRPAPAAVTQPGLTEYEIWIRDNEPTGIQLEIQRRMSTSFSYRPKVSVLVPVYKVAPEVLRDTLESVLAQTYDNWELCISVPGPDNPEAVSYVKQASARDPRVRLIVLAANQGISGNSNQALTLATGEYLALLDHDDTLAPYALFEVVQLLNQNTAVNFIYSDKDQITEDGLQRTRPLFKPEWSPEVMWNANYLTHLCVMRSECVRQVGGWRSETDGAQDWDLFLRVINRFGGVRHLPKVLYHWRQIHTSVASGGLDAKPYAAAGQVQAVKDHCASIGLKVDDVVHVNGELRLLWPEPAEDRVSIIYLSSSTTDTASFATNIKHPNFEILVPADGSNLVEQIELTVGRSTGRFLVFIDEAVTPSASDWLTELTGPLRFREIGLVGGKFLDANTRMLRHCGLVFTAEGNLEYIYAGQPEHVSEQAGTAGWYRNWSAVTGACFSIRRDVWDEIGGFSGDLQYPRLDVHLCLKLLLQTEYRILYNPYVRLLQTSESVLERPLSGARSQAADSIRSRFPSGDPYFNVNLDCCGGRVAYKEPRHTGAPSSDYAAESRVLVDIYDFAPAQVVRSRRTDLQHGTGRLETITWFLPEFNNAFYGGIHTILRFADGFRRKFQVQSHFCVLGHVPESRVRQQVSAAFPDLGGSSLFSVLDGHNRANELPRSDASICSLWTTAYAALTFEKTRRKFYFIQDDEALFYPAGSISALVEATYGFGFHGLCNTVSLRDAYVQRGGQGEYFQPCIDTRVFHDRGRKAVDGPSPFTVFCYGRPGHPRNCFELLAASMRILRKRMGDRILLISAGASWDPRDHGLDGIVHNLGLLNYQSTGALYRICDAGLVMMMTRHPSYLPMELMACGSLVVTNRNASTGWLLEDGENCLLSDLSPTSIADRVEEGLKNIASRARITRNASKMVNSSYTNWDAEIEKIYRYMLSLC